jgi:23S rRNA pseudouridine955/2504/2580 synthase
LDFQRFKAGPDDAGRRTDRILRRLFPDTPLSALYSLIRRGLIRVNGKGVTPGFLLRGGDVISAPAFLGGPEQKPGGGGPGDFPFVMETLFCSRDLRIIAKPAGLCVHAGPGVPSVAGWLTSLETPESLAFVPAPLHRLDKGTTGALVCSRSIRGAVWFSQALRERRIRKRYLAIAQGSPAGEETWDEGLERESGSIPERAVTVMRPLGKGAFLGLGVFLAEFTIGTGRKHQIRKHSALHGFPLLGDSRYGGAGTGGQGYFLHGAEIAFPGDNPLGAPPSVSAPLPEAFRAMLETCGLGGLLG